MPDLLPAFSEFFLRRKLSVNGEIYKIIQVRSIFLALAFVATCFVATSSPLDSIGVVKINDKIHIKYMVSPGETIYGISTKYGVGVAELMEINPELENGLKVGQIINIPYYPELVKREKKNEDAITHKVQPGETLFGLSKKYNVPLNDLLKWNGMELKAGQEIVIGKKGQENTAAVKTEEKKDQQNSNSVITQTETKPVETKEPAKKGTETGTATDAAQKEEIKQTSSDNYVYRFDPDRKQILVIPFDPYLYFSDCDDEIAAKSNMPRNKVRQMFRRRLNALLDKPGYEMIYLVGGKSRDSLSDLNKIYSSVSYQVQPALMSPYYQVNDNPKDNQNKKDKNWINKQKDKLTKNNNSDSKYDVPEDHGAYFGVKIKNPEEFFNYFNTKYSIDYYIFISQFEVKTNYEHCLDRSALNFERSFTTHYSIYNKDGKQISGNKFKTHYNSNTNYIYQIVSDNVPKIADRILGDIPPAESND